MVLLTQLHSVLVIQVNLPIDSLLESGQVLSPQSLESVNPSTTMAPPCTNKEDKLDESNSTHWRLTMMLRFQKKGLWDIVDRTETRLERLAGSSNNRWTQFQEEEYLKSVVDWDIQNLKALSAIVQSVSKEVSPIIQTLKIAHGSLVVAGQWPLQVAALDHTWV